MNNLPTLLAALALIVALAALLVALAPRKTDNESRLRDAELSLVHLHDGYQALLFSLKKLHGRQQSREARERDQSGAAPAAAAVANPLDPMARLPGETGEQWKARMGRTVAGVSTRRN